jgi:tetratricopeptide (TPR) repeat protein
VPQENGARRLPPEVNIGLAVVLGASALFLLVLALGSTYAGIRHALPAVVLLAIPGGFAVQVAFSANSKLLKVVVVASLFAAGISALPVMRPWEYFNEIIGGAKNGYLYFNDEGVDLWQRSKELASYYHQVLEPVGEIPLLAYGTIEPEKKARKLDWLGRDKKRDEARLTSSVFTGTIIANARFLGEQPFWDAHALRHTIPSGRFGNLLIFHGTCECGSILAPDFYFPAESKIHAEKPDFQEAEKLLRQSIALDPSAFFVHIELGNLLVRRGAREDALQAYSAALQHAPNDAIFRHPIEDQMKQVSAGLLNQVPELRNPFME